MKKQKLMKWALPALLLSAMTFELLPGSVICYENTSAIRAFNFYTTEAPGMAASYLSAAGLVTAVAVVLAFAAMFSKTPLYRLTGWFSLAAAALAAMPYVQLSENAVVQPNVVILLLLMGAWLMAMLLQKKKDDKKEEQNIGRRL